MGYIGSFRHKEKLAKTREGELRFALGCHHGRTSGASTVLPIWVNGSFRPVRVRLIRGKTELLAGMHIVKKLGVQVCLGSDRSNVGQGGWEMMNFNEKHRWLFPLVPTACAYTKLGEYFGKSRKSEIEALQIQGDFGGNSAGWVVAKTKNQRSMSTMGKSKAIISDIEAQFKIHY